MAFKNLYALLGLSPAATEAEIKEAMREKAQAQSIGLDDLKFCRKYLLDADIRKKYNAKLYAEFPEVLQQMVEEKAAAQAAAKAAEPAAAEPEAEKPVAKSENANLDMEDGISFAGNEFVSREELDSYRNALTFDMVLLWAILLRVVSGVCVLMSLYKLWFYDEGRVNAYVGGDAFNYIISGTHSTTYAILAVLAALCSRWLRESRMSNSQKWGL